MSAHSYTLQPPGRSTAQGNEVAPKKDSVPTRSDLEMSTKVEDFVRQHHQPLIRFLSARLRSSQEAADVAQETYQWLLNHKDDPRVIAWVDPINPLVYRVAWNIAGNRIQRRRRHARLDQEAFEAQSALQQHAPSPQHVHEAQEDLAIIERSLRELPAPCRTVFILARFEGLSFEEVARRMNISVRSVYRYVERVLEYCMDQLDEAECDGTAATVRQDPRREPKSCHQK